MTDPVFLHPLPEVCTPGQVVALTGAEARHMEVKRLRTGESLILSDGRGHAIRAQWEGTQHPGEARGQEDGQVHSQTDGQAAYVRVTEFIEVQPAHPCVSVVQAIPKADRAELAVDLMTQAGADRIIAWAAQRCISKWDGKTEKARAKWRNAARAAAKQSRRLLLPHVLGPLHNPAQLPSFIPELSTDSTRTLILVLHESATVRLSECTFAEVDEVILVVGPEGGINDEELGQWGALGAIPVRLGREVLRTASAASVALGALGVLTPRWGKATIG